MLISVFLNLVSIFSNSMSYDVLNHELLWNLQFCVWICKRGFIKASKNDLHIFLASQTIPKTLSNYKSRYTVKNVKTNIHIGKREAPEGEGWGWRYTDPGLWAIAGICHGSTAGYNLLK